MFIFWKAGPAHGWREGQGIDHAGPPGHILYQQGGEGEWWNCQQITPTKAGVFLSPASSKQRCQQRQEGLSSLSATLVLRSANKYV